MLYEEAMSYLASAMRFGIRPGLERTRALLSQMGHPERAMRFLHVAGTNGKGSVSVMAEAALRASGIRTGLFTSPHLAEYNERIKTDGRDISKDRLASWVEVVKQAADCLTSEGIESPTEFELCTALCLGHFRSEGVRMAVMEVGLGGRYDSTNVIEPDVSVITHISYDHMERLGKSLSEIAFDKCGILRKGVPVVCAKQDAEALQMIMREASAKGSPLWLPGAEYDYSLSTVSLQGTEISYRGHNLQGCFKTRLVGVHQADNAAAALASLDLLIEIGWNIDEADIAEGFEGAIHPGRFEVIGGNPVMILDGAHNLDGAEALSKTLRAVLPGVKPVAMMGFSADKPYDRMIETLAPQISALFATGISHTRSGAAEPEDILQAGRTSGIESYGIRDHADCLGKASELAAARGVPLLICGSLYLIGEVRKMALSKGVEHVVL